jgi:hypothetical protein
MKFILLDNEKTNIEIDMILKNVMVPHGDIKHPVYQNRDDKYILVLAVRFVPNSTLKQVCFLNEKLMLEIGYFNNEGKNYCILKNEFIPEKNICKYIGKFEEKQFYDIFLEKFYWCVDKKCAFTFTFNGTNELIINEFETYEEARNYFKKNRIGAKKDE